MGKLIIKKAIMILIPFLCLVSCHELADESVLQNESVVINNNLFIETTTNNYTITDVNLNGNLLSIKISSSGCCGDSWAAVLVDADEILESNPVQRNIKFSLENTEACLAIFEKEFTFEIGVLKEDFTEVILNLTGWDTQINYN